MVRVSVIIPVYNSKNYLDKLINSLLNQTLKDMEFIFVNDGSTDESREIIENYQKKDNRILLYNKKNGGQASARNLGLKYANGEYVAFLDSDDYVKENMYELLYNKSIQYKSDITICNYYLASSKIIKNESPFKEKEREVTLSEYITLTPSPWDKIIKREFLLNNNFKFIEGIIYEDYATMPTLALYNPKIVYINEYLHYYVQTASSTMRNDEYKEKYENIFTATKYLYDKMINKGFNLELEYLITYHFLYLASLNFYKFKKYDQIDKISHDMKKYFPNFKKNQLVRSKFTKKEIFYMNLFYKKQYRLINVYRRLSKKGEN